MSVVVALLLLICLWLLPAMLILGSAIEHRRRLGLAGISPRERALAELRSAELLRDVLDERELQQLAQHGYVDVASPSREGRVYRIPRDAGRVRVFDDGRARVELCIQPVTPLPANDVIALHKLMIEGNEQGYLARANEIPLTLPSRLHDQQTWTFLMP